MNSTNLNVTTATVDFIREAIFYQVYDFTLLSSSTLLFYSILLKLSQEIEVIWLNLNFFSLPAFLYVFTRYPTFIYQILVFSTYTRVISTKTCDAFYNTTNTMGILSYVGVQGLLVARAYSLCRGSRILSRILTFGFFSVLVLNVFEIIAFPGCQTSIKNELIIIQLLINILTIFTDVLILSICIQKIWGIWRLRRETGLRCFNGLIFIFFAQTIFSCVVVFAEMVVSQITYNSNFAYNSIQILSIFQTALQAILVADSTLYLRCHNSKRIEDSSISLPSLQIQTVLQHVHRSFIVELATPEDTSVDDSSSDNDGN